MPSAALASPSLQHVPPPLTRLQQTWRIAAAAAFGLVTFVLQFTEQIPDDTVLPLVDLLLGIAALILVAWRRRRPVLIATLIVAATTVSGLAVGAAILAVVSLATTRRTTPLVALCGLGALTGVAGIWIHPWMRVMDSLVGDLVLGFASGLIGVAVPVLIGSYIAGRRELASSLVERADLAERHLSSSVEAARAQERALIAREMHDVLAHRISLIALHAGAMTYRDDLSRDDLVESAQVVQVNAHKALEDVREVLGVLRSEHLQGASREATAGDPGQAATAGPGARRPQPTLTDLEALVEELRHLGGSVDLRRDLTADPATLPDLVGLAAYRIVQESLTNARKHAPQAPVAVEIAGGPGVGLTLVVSNPVVSRSGRPSYGAVPGSGAGLAGLAERVELAGGRFDAGAEGPDFVVRAWLPWRG